MPNLQDQIKAIEAIQAHLTQADTLLRSMEFSPVQVNNPEIGKHYTAMETHLDNSIGRLSTLRQTISRINKFSR